MRLAEDTLVSSVFWSVLIGQQLVLLADKSASMQRRKEKKNKFCQALRECKNVLQ